MPRATLWAPSCASRQPSRRARRRCPRLSTVSSSFVVRTNRSRSRERHRSPRESAYAPQCAACSRLSPPSRSAQADAEISRKHHQPRSSVIPRSRRHERWRDDRTGITTGEAPERLRRHGTYTWDVGPSGSRDEQYPIRADRRRLSRLRDRRFKEVVVDPHIRDAATVVADREVPPASYDVSAGREGLDPDLSKVPYPQPGAYGVVGPIAPVVHDRGGVQAAGTDQVFHDVPHPIGQEHLRVCARVRVRRNGRHRLPSPFQSISKAPVACFWLPDASSEMPTALS